jgi:hypothetical protein
VIERVLTIVAGNGQKSGRGQALIESVGKGVADPGEVGLAGAVVEGKDKYQATASLDDLRG